MTQLSFTSGEIMDVMSLLDNKINSTEDPHRAAYYGNIYQQFESVLNKLEELPGEKRVANLVMAL